MEERYTLLRHLLFTCKLVPFCCVFVVNYILCSLYIVQNHVDNVKYVNTVSVSVYDLKALREYLI